MATQQGTGLLWTSAALEPKRKFRYMINFSNPDLKDFTFLAQTCDRPGVKIGMAEHKYFNKSFFHPGKVTWDPNPLSIKLVDIQKISNVSSTDTNESLLKVFLNSGLSGLINNDGSVVTIGKKAAVNALGDFTISVLNSSLEDLPTNDTPALPAGQARQFPTSQQDKAISEQWLLKNAYLESFKPDSLDYGAEDILTVTMTVRYDWAEFKSHDLSLVNPFAGGGQD